MTASLPAIREDNLATLAALVREAQAVAVIDHDTYTAAAAARAKAKKLIKELEEERKQLTRPLDDQKKEVMAMFAPYLDQLNTAEATLAQKLINFDAEQEREQARKQRELEEYTRRKAQEEADKRALEAIERGDMDGAEAALAEAETVAVPQLAPVKPVAGSGAHYRDNWTFEITDEQAAVGELVRRGAVALLQVDQKQLRIMVKELSGKIEIAGVKIWNERTLITK